MPNLSDALLWDVEMEAANLHSVNLRGADLSNANLGCTVEVSPGRAAERICANLKDADMQGAILEGADLDGADLTDADLTHAKGMTSEDLDYQASSLEGATMPNGQKYEDWLKSKGSGEE